jgi:hypothetical protein
MLYGQSEDPVQIGENCDGCSVMYSGKNDRSAKSSKLGGNENNEDQVMRTGDSECRREQGVRGKATMIRPTDLTDGLLRWRIIECVSRLYGKIGSPFMQIAIQVIEPFSGGGQNTPSLVKNIVKSFHNGLSLDERKVTLTVFFPLLTFIQIEFCGCVEGVAK